MKEAIHEIMERVGTYIGEGINHENQKFMGTLTVEKIAETKGVSISFKAVGEDGAIYHEEKSMIAPSMDGSVSLYVVSSNHPGITPHAFKEKKEHECGTHSYVFGFGEPDDKTQFREFISLDFWPEGDVGYRYAWGLPKGDFQERSKVRMKRV